MVKPMKEEKFREVNKCIYCKYWLGQQPKTNLLRGTCSYKECKSMCALDDTESFHSSSDLCHRFEKNRLYL